MTRRMEKVHDLVQTELAQLLQREVKDPALQGVVLSITHVEVSPDLANARVHVSVLAEAEVEDAALAALRRAEPYLHRQLVGRLHMRRVPRLRFIADHSMAEADRISALMREVARSEGREL